MGQGGDSVGQGGDSVGQGGDPVGQGGDSVGQARDSVGQGHLNVAGVSLLAFFSVLPPQEQREKTICSVSQALPCCWGLPPCQNL